MRKTDEKRMNTYHCKFHDGNKCVYHLLQSGVKGNNIVVICESPTQASKELNRPLVGRTGTNLCRVFERLKAMDSNRYEKFCTRTIMILNAFPDKIDDGKRVRFEDAGIFYEDFGREAIKDMQIVICMGKKAIDFYSELCDGDESCDEDDGLYGKNQICIEICHLGDRGLASLSFQGGKKVKISTEQKLDILAEWIDYGCTKKGKHTLDCFQQYFLKRIQKGSKIGGVK